MSVAPSTCKNLLCQQSQINLDHEFRQFAILNGQIEDCQKLTVAEGQILHEIKMELDKLTSLQQILSRNLSGRESEVDSLLKSLHQKKMARIQLEDEILQLKKELKRSQHAATKSIVRRLPKKHNGSFSPLQSGVYRWSCCLADKIDAVGCCDDCSIDLKSTLRVCEVGDRGRQRPRSAQQNPSLSGFRRLLLEDTSRIMHQPFSMNQRKIGKMRELTATTFNSSRNRPMSSSGRAHDRKYETNENLNKS